MKTTMDTSLERDTQPSLDRSSTAERGRAHCECGWAFPIVSEATVRFNPKVPTEVVAAMGAELETISFRCGCCSKQWTYELPAELLTTTIVSGGAGGTPS